jgi:CRISPR-associated protein Csm3
MGGHPRHVGLLQEVMRLNEFRKNRYELRIELETPLHIGGGRSTEGIETVRRNRMGIPFIPASTVKGRWRDALRKIQPSPCTLSDGDTVGECGCLACEIFGSQGYRPSRIVLTDCSLHPNDQLEMPRTTVRNLVGLDRYRRTARDGALAFFEVVPEGSVFEGEFETNSAIVGEQLGYLLAALESIRAIGAHKSRGIGFVRITAKEVEA